MAQTGWFEKVAKSYFEKDVDRGLELAEYAYRNGQGNIRLGLVKLNLKLEAKTESAWKLLR